MLTERLTWMQHHQSPDTSSLPIPKTTQFKEMDDGDERMVEAAEKRSRLEKGRRSPTTNAFFSALLASVAADSSHEDNAQSILEEHVSRVFETNPLVWSPSCVHTPINGNSNQRTQYQNPAVARTTRRTQCTDKPNPYAMRSTVRRFSNQGEILDDEDGISASHTDNFQLKNTLPVVAQQQWRYSDTVRNNISPKCCRQNDNMTSDGNRKTKLLNTVCQDDVYTGTSPDFPSKGHIIPKSSPGPSSQYIHCSPRYNTRSSSVLRPSKLDQRDVMTFDQLRTTTSSPDSSSSRNASCLASSTVHGRAESSSLSNARLKACNAVESTSDKLATTSDGVTIVGYYFCDEPIPYRTTLPGKNPTLGQFKHLLTKKGSLRYFFKKVSDEFDSGVVHEEVKDDDDLLPLWEGKVVGKVERIQ